VEYNWTHVLAEEFLSPSEIFKREEEGENRVVEPLLHLCGVYVTLLISKKQPGKIDTVTKKKGTGLCVSHPIFHKRRNL